jgi:hypothetical protein
MAYPFVDAPYGFSPVNQLAGYPYAGAVRQIPIGYGYAANIFNGDLVELAAGVVNVTGMTTSTAGTARAGQVGVFVGCSYTSPVTGQKLFANNWPSGTLANDGLAYVVDDPYAVFKVCVIGQPSAGLSNTATTVGFVNQNFVGSNVYCVTGGGGNLLNGTSFMGVSGDQPTNGTGNVRQAAARPFRIVGITAESAVTLTGTGTSSGTAVTLSAAVTGLQAGMQLIVPNVTNARPGDFCTVTNVNGTAVTISRSVTIAAATTLTFVGYPEVLVKWNAAYHSYEFATGI